MYFKYMNLWYVTYVKLLKKKKNNQNADQKIIWREMETKFCPPPHQISSIQIVWKFGVTVRNFHVRISFMGNRRYVFIAKKRQIIWTEVFI